MDLHGVTTKSVEPIHTGSSKVDIFLELFEAPDGSVLGHVEYDSSLWQRASIHSFVTAFHVSFRLTLHTSSSLLLSFHLYNSFPWAEASVHPFVAAFHVSCRLTRYFGRKPPFVPLSVLSCRLQIHISHCLHLLNMPHYICLPACQVCSISSFLHDM